jgi:hypothetical protein
MARSRDDFIAPQQEVVLSTTKLSPQSSGA